MTSKNTYTEKELVFLLKQKDRNAFDYLYDKYAASFYGIIIKCLGKDEKIAQDILQDAFLKIWKNVESYDNLKEGFFIWMYKIVNAVLKDKVEVRENISIQIIRTNVSR